MLPGQGTAYRVDVLTSSKGARDLSEPTGIFELRTGDRLAAEGEGESVVRFEVNREQMADVLKQVAAIEACIEKAT